MSELPHHWNMTNIEYGFTVFEKCLETNAVRTYFSTEDTWDEYREGDNHWSIVENAQTFRFDLTCRNTGRLESFRDLMGLMYCTSCMEDCEVEILQKELLKRRCWVLVAFGYLPEAKDNGIPQKKLEILTDHFNQRRDTSRSTVKIIPFTLIKDISLCKGEFIHDVGMLSLEPPEERKPLF
ncbi:hypothetical protein GF377_01435 [candidate division GN15 bacterium]|nr:hypothetical protein [candidate division GN15 bacterium]